jgi:hypothetical protein
MPTSPSPELALSFHFCENKKRGAKQNKKKLFFILAVFLAKSKG